MRLTAAALLLAFPSHDAPLVTEAEATWLGESLGPG